MWMRKQADGKKTENNMATELVKVLIQIVM